MVSQAEGITAPEIAAKYDRELSTVQRVWKVAPWWPPAIGKRGKWSVYDAAAVDAAVQARLSRPEPATETAEGEALNPEDLLTAKEVAAYTGLSPSTIRSDVSRNRIRDADPADTDAGRVKRWRRRAIDEDMSKRRGYSRTD